MIGDNKFLGICWAVFDKRDKRTYLVGLGGDEGNCTCGGYACSHVMTVESQFMNAYGLPGDDDLPEFEEPESQAEPELEKRRVRPSKAV